jgi:hypothetical protein
MEQVQPVEVLDLDKEVGLRKGAMRRAACRLEGERRKLKTSLGNGKHLEGWPLYAILNKLAALTVA